MVGFYLPGGELQPAGGNRRGCVTTTKTLSCKTFLSVSPVTHDACQSAERRGHRSILSLPLLSPPPLRRVLDMLGMSLECSGGKRKREMTINRLSQHLRGRSARQLLDGWTNREEKERDSEGHRKKSELVGLYARLSVRPGAQSGPCEPLSLYSLLYL